MLHQINVFTNGGYIDISRVSIAQKIILSSNVLYTKKLAHAHLSLYFYHKVRTGKKSNNQIIKRVFIF